MKSDLLVEEFDCEADYIYDSDNQKQLPYRAPSADLEADGRSAVGTPVGFHTYLVTALFTFSDMHVIFAQAS